MAPDVGQEELQAVAGPVNGVGRRDDRLLGGSADFQPDGLELVRDLCDFLVAEVELEGERLDLGRLDVAALFGSLEEVAARLGVKSFVHGVLAQLFLLVLSLNEGRVDCAAGWDFCGSTRNNVLTLRLIPSSAYPQMSVLTAR